MDSANPISTSIVPQIVRGVMQTAGGAIPIAGGFLSALAGAWSEKEQAKINKFLQNWLEMLQDEIKEKEKTVFEIMARIDMQDEKISARVESSEFQKLVKKCFRDWACVESEEKRAYVRNILSNAACSEIVSDDVIRLFLEWISMYSELHLKVIASIYNADGISRKGIWEKIGKGIVREDSADADLYKLLIRDLSTGGLIRQHREVDYQGNFIAKRAPKKPTTYGTKTLSSAFDDEDLYELSELGKQFIHYAMTDLPPRISYQDHQ